MPGRIIINADDFGLTSGINRAVAELHDAGALSSTTLMAGGPAFEQAAALARARPALGVGCHLVFVDGTPLSPPGAVPSLLGPDGRSFRNSLLDFAQASLRGRIRPADLAREAEAQITRLQQAGIAVTHVDTHKHTHAFPPVARAILHAAARCGVFRFRNPFEPRWSRTLSRRFASLSRTIAWELINSFAPSLRHDYLATSGERTTAGTLSVLATGSLSPALLEAWFQQVAAAAGGEVFELCVHPGYVDAALKLTTTRLLTSRETERHTLLHTVPNLLAVHAPIRMVHFGDLPGTA